jgi:hypothetical protein
MSKNVGIIDFTVADLDEIITTGKRLNELTKLTAGGFTAVEDLVGAFDKRFAHLEGHVAELSKVVRNKPVIVKAKTGKLFLVGVVALSAYVGYKYAEKQINEKRKQEQADKWKRSNQAYTTAPSDNGQDPAAGTDQVLSDDTNA